MEDIKVWSAVTGALIEDVTITAHYDRWEYDVKTSKSTKLIWYLYDIEKNLVYTYEPESLATHHSGTFGGYIPSGEDGYIHLKAVSSEGDMEWWPSEDEMYKLERPATTENQPPSQPINVSPSDGATGIGLTPTLSSSSFSDPDIGDTHATSQWQVTTTSGDYSSPIFDSSDSPSNLNQLTIPSTTLSYSTTY